MNIKIENWKLLILSVFYFIFAILSYTITKEQYTNFFMITGIVIALLGLFQVLVYFMKKDYMKPNEFRFSFGVLYMLVGIVIACKPYIIVDNYPIVLSGLVVLDSILRLQYAMNLLRLEIGQWKIHTLLAILPIAAGMSLILCTFDEHTLHNLFSFLLIFDAIANFYTILYYKHITKSTAYQEEQILDMASKELEEKEHYDGHDLMV